MDFEISYGFQFQVIQYLNFSVLLSISFMFMLKSFSLDI